MSSNSQSAPQKICRMQDALDALKVSKITLMMQKNTSFYTTILFSLKQALVTTLPTAATDGRNLLINPTFFADLTPNERIGLLAHEVLHVALDHMHRRGDRDPKLWNIAADYVINLFLHNAKYVLPKGGLLDQQYAGKSTEEVYNLLKKKSDKEMQDILSKCSPGGMNGNDVSYPEDAAPGSEVPQEEVTATILRATNQAKMVGQPPGSLPGEIEIELQRTLNPPLPWHVILQNYLTDFSKDDYSFRRPNRRFLPDYYLPMAHSEAIPNIAIAVDTSGSVSAHEFNTFITKIAEIQATMNPKKITVVAFDTKIKNVQELCEGSDPFKELKFIGRGGTAIGPVHEWAAENKPTLLIIFTDGEFPIVKPINKSVPIFWLIHANPKWSCDHGRVVHYDIKKE